MEWTIRGAEQDGQSVTADWSYAPSELIEGVRVKEIRSVPKEGGWVTEVFRSDWKPDGAGVDQVFMTELKAGSVSAWHAHRTTTDRLFAARGMVKVVL